jgi:thiol-disulfide isomerase/thioredoxin
MNMKKVLFASFAFALTFMATQAGAAPTIQEFKPDSLATIVKKEDGKPFLLLVWSLDCEYCQASLKTLSEEMHKRKDLRVVTVSTDSLEDPQAAGMMRERLASFGVQSNAWAFGSVPPEQLRFAIDPKWHGEMPRSYWFNSRGEKTAYSGVITPNVIDKLAIH